MYLTYVFRNSQYINTLIYAGKIASEQSPAEIAHFAQKIGKNRLISEKIVSWDFVPPFDFAAQFLASRAQRRGEHTSPSSSKNLTNPVWCGAEDSIHGVRGLFLVHSDFYWLDALGVLPVEGGLMHGEDEENWRYVPIQSVIVIFLPAMTALFLTKLFLGWP